jgi:beta-1,4-N-acetylglucosaminyltransferase
MGVLYDGMETPKIGIITSRGGHLFQMYRLKPWWKKYNHFWVTFPGEDTSSLLNKEKIYYGHHPESRNGVNAVRNLFLAFKVLNIEKPTMLISCGAGIAPPFFYAGKLLGIKLVFIEPYDFIAYPSLSGKLVAPIVNELLVQHKEQLRFFRNAKYKGALL